MSEDHLDAPPSAGLLHLILLRGRTAKLRGIRPIRRLTPVEDAAYRKGSRHLHDFKHSRELFPLVRMNAESVVKGAISITGQPSEKLRETPTREHLGREYNRLIINFLASFRLYLDQMPKRLIRRYTKDSDQFRALEGARKLAYDTTPEYRITYKARDFVLHCGMLVPGVRFSEGLEPGPEPRITHTVSLECRRDYLIEQWGRDWRQAYADILAMPEWFSIHRTFVTATRALHRVDTAVMESERPELLKSAQVIVDLLGEVPNEPDSGVGAAELELEPPNTNIKFVHVPANVVGWLGLPYERIAQF